MIRLSPHVTMHARGDAAFAWHNQTGEVAQMSRDVLALLLAYRKPGRLEDAGPRRAGELTRADAEQFVKVLLQRGFLIDDTKSERTSLLLRYPIVSPTAVWIERDDGGLDVYGRHGRAARLDAIAAALLKRCTGRDALTDIVEGGDATVLSALCRYDVAALKMLDSPAIPRPPPSVASTMPWPELADPDAYVKGAAPTGTDPHDMAAYHATAITDATQQFEEIETTLSHLFRHPHDALGGRTFGQALALGLRGNGLFSAVSGTPRTVETGGGIGFLGEAMRSALALSTWPIVDLSPALARSQRARGLSPMLGDARRLPLRDRSIDLLVSNEMAGDLGTEGGLNVGALALVKEVARVLRPGGLAYVSEFGSPSDPPRRSDHLDHDEWSLRFDDLATVARSAGLEAEVVSVPKLIGLDPTPQALSTTRATFAALRALFAAHGVTLDKRAWTRPALEQASAGKVDLSRIRGLTFRPLGERTMGLVPGEFWALIARRR